MNNSGTTPWQALRRRVGRLFRTPVFGSGRSAKRRQYREMLKAESAADRFERIYAQNLWNDYESASGSGSSLDTTRQVRGRLPLLIEQYNVKRFLDAPCGDFNWMSSVMTALPDVQYVGGDIVASMIEQNQQGHSSANIRFMRLDITQDALPAADLMMVRDCLFHFSYEDIALFLSNLAKADVDLLLTSSHHLADGRITNCDIVSGDFRPIDLFSEPFCFPSKPLLRFDDSDEERIGKSLCLFRVAPLLEHLHQHSALFLHSASVPGTP